MVRVSCVMSAVPKDLPPKSTVHHYFMLWECLPLCRRVRHRPRPIISLTEGHPPEPTAPRRRPTTMPRIRFVVLPKRWIVERRS